MKNIFLSLLLTGVLALSNQVAAQTALKDIQAKGLTPLNATQLTTFLTGNTLYHINPSNAVKVPLYYVADGTRYVRIRGQVMRTSWRIERDMVCEESVVLKREVCRSLYRSEGAGAVCDEGSDVCAYGMDWAEGNVEKLGQ